MSTFAVTVEQIDRIWAHQNADLLEMASLVGKDYDFVVQKGKYHPGDAVVYFPVDSLLPMWITEKLGLTGKLAHGVIPDDGSPRLQNRVKTVRLRGNLSQGVVCAPQDLFESDQPAIGEDITARLGVEKYEPPMQATQYGKLAPLPSMVSRYDIESAQNFTRLIDVLMAAPVIVTEKLEGSHWALTLYADGDLAVSQRGYRIIPTEDGEHDWHKVVRLYQLDEKIRALFADIQTLNVERPRALTLRGELLGPGVQGNLYKRPQHEIRIFEIELNGVPVDAHRFLDFAARHSLPTVPVLASDVTLRDWLAGKSVKDASNGQSQLASVMREGIVIRPMRETIDAQLGRLILKQRSPEYLAKSDL